MLDVLVIFVFGITLGMVIIFFWKDKTKRANDETSINSSEYKQADSEKERIVKSKASEQESKKNNTRENRNTTAKTPLKSKKQSSHEIGEQGEQRVHEELSKLPMNKYAKLDNIFLTDGESWTSQIDHIVFSEYGIFVCETKKRQGYLIGKKSEKNWTACYGGNKKYPIQNPIKQNEKHIDRLAEVLKIERKYFFSIIAFNEEVKLNIGEANESVIRYSEIVNEIEGKRRKVFEKAAVDAYYKTVVNLDVRDGSERKKYIRKLKIKRYRCAWCDGKLEWKNPNGGSPFLGCSNFTSKKCKFTVNQSEANKIGIKY